MTQAQLTPYLSWSRIRTIQTCSLRYYFQYISDEVPEFTSASLAFGSAFHRAVEEDLVSRLAGHPQSVGHLVEIFRWSLKEIGSGAPIKWGAKEGLDESIEQARRMLEVWLAWDPCPGGIILGVEQEFSVEVKPWLPPLKGVVDLMLEFENHLLLVDVKTSRSRWNEEKIAEGRDQLVLYQEGLRDLIMGIGKPVQLAWDVVTKARTPVVERVYLEGERPLERALRMATIALEVIDRQLFSPSPSPMNCGSCPFQRPCRSW